MVNVSKFDAAQHLKDDEDIALYIAEALDTGNPKLISKAMGTVARARGMTRLAEESGVSREQLYRSFSENGNPTLKTFMAVLNALHVKLEAVPDQTVDVAGAIKGTQPTGRRATVARKAAPKRI